MNTATLDAPVTVRPTPAMNTTPAAVPAAFGQVQSIVPAGPESVRITGENGQAVTCPINWQFLKS